MKNNTPIFNNNSDNFNEKMQKARWYLIEEEYEEAKKTLLKILLNREYAKDNYILYYWLGISCFGCNDITAAQKYFEITLEKSPTHIISKLYLAIISVLSSQNKNAIEYLLFAQREVKELNNNNYSKYVRNCLNAIKNNVSDENKLLKIYNHPFSNKLLPRFGRKLKAQKTTRNTLFFSLLFISMSLITWFTIGDWVITLFTPNNARMQIIKNIDQKLQAEEFKEQGLDKVKIILSDKEYKKLIVKIEKDFINFRDNRVWITSNNILHSNRSQKEKNKVIFITRNLSGVKYTSDVLWLEFDKIIENPWKYEHVVVKWKGTIAQYTINETQKFNTAQFLINYYGTSKELSATVLTYIPKNITLTNGDEVELLASILVPSPRNTIQEIELQVESFRRLR